MTTQEIQFRETAATGMVLTRREVQALEFSDSQRQLIRDAYAKGATDEEFAVLMEIAKARALNPLLRQVFFVARWDTKLGRETWATQVSIDGLRAVAERTGLYAGQDKPAFTYKPDGSILCCEVAVFRKDWPRPAVGIAFFDEYVQTVRDKATGKMFPAKFWKQMPHVMIAKCAESLGLRKAFPEDTANLYTAEEMGQADNDAPQRSRRGQLSGGVEARQLGEGDPRNTPVVDDAEEPDAIAPPTCADLAGLAAWYAELGLGADDSARGDDAFGLATDHLIALGYLLSGAEIHRALSGNLSGVLRHVHDVLAAESTADGVARAYGAVRTMVADCEDKHLRAECKVVAARYYGQRHEPKLKGTAAQTALAAALAPKPDGPGGGQRTLATQAPPDAHGSAAPVAASAAPLASANDGPRRVYDDEHRRPTPHKPEPWQLDAALMRAHIAGKGSRTEIERAAACHGEHQGAAFLALLAAQLVVVDRAYQKRTTGRDVAMSLTQARMVVDRCAFNGTLARAEKAAAEALSQAA